jgi:hypothetical protein
MTTNMLSGYLRIGPDGDHDDALLLVADPKGRDWYCSPLAEMAQDALGRRPGLVSVRYALSEHPIADLDSAAADEIAKLDGDLDLLYHHAYSEITGYLWTDEDFKVGGHDLIARLRGYVGMWLLLEIVTHG